MVRGDPGRLRQILTNLISNAIKFTPSGAVNVRATWESENDTHVVLRFEVADTGIGVPEEARACLFQPFSQVDASTTRKYGGTGLGLAICKQLVNLMAGQIGCSSIPDNGSVFWFTVRFEKPAESTSHEEFAPGTGQDLIDAQQRLPAARRRGIRILVAEDNAFNQKVVLRQVREMGFGADAVANGIEALEALDRIPYDLVLMDCQMPEMDGYECSAEIRRREDHGQHVPIIAMTAHVMKEDRDKCLAAGMDDFLSKPVRVAHLEAILIQWFTDSPAPPASGTVARPAAPPERRPAANADQDDRPDALLPLPPVDLDLFSELGGNNAERLRELADRYVHQTTEQLAKLRNAIATGVASDVKRIAHSAAGSSAMCGMSPMVALLRELERMGQAGRLAGAPRVYAQIEKEFGRIEQFLNTHLDAGTVPQIT